MTLDVQPGDMIVHGRNLSQQLSKVERLTATQVICERDVKFNIKTGKRVGNVGLDAAYGRKASPDEIQRVTMKIRVRAAAASIQRIIVSENNIDAAEAFIAAANKVTGTDNE